MEDILINNIIVPRFGRLIVCTKATKTVVEIIDLENDYTIKSYNKEDNLFFYETKIRNIRIVSGFYNNLLYQVVNGKVVCPLRRFNKVDYQGNLISDTSNYKYCVISGMYYPNDMVEQVHGIGCVNRDICYELYFYTIDKGWAPFYRYVTESGHYCFDRFIRTIDENGNEIERNDSEDLIHRYDYIPDEFHMHDLTGGRKSKQQFSVGIEIEVESKQGKRYNTTKILNEEYSENEKLFYLVHDGSLRNGIEIVTHPFFVNQLHGSHLIVKRLLPMLSYINNNRTQTSERCGLHIHIGRKELKKDCVSKLQYLFELFEKELLKFSRRGDNLSYTRLIKIFKHNNKKSIYNCISPIVDGMYKEDSKYVSINTLHKHTIEIRLWSGTQQPSEIEANIEMTMLLFSIANSMTITEIRNLSFDDIVNMSSNRNFKKCVKEWVR